MANNNNNSVPDRGYILPLWNNNNAYRSTAYAYMLRLNLTSVQHSNGSVYEFDEVRKALIGETNENPGRAKITTKI